jgi:hypothetical protein
LAAADEEAIQKALEEALEEAFEERAGICEFDAHLDRWVAEERARQEASKS